MAANSTPDGGTEPDPAETDPTDNSTGVEPDLERVHDLEGGGGAQGDATAAGADPEEAAPAPP